MVKVVEVVEVVEVGKVVAVGIHNGLRWMHWCGESQ